MVHAYDYAVLRLVPDVCREASLNIGVALHSRTAGFLALYTQVDAVVVQRLAPSFDLDLLGAFLDALEAIAQGNPTAGPIGLLPPSERFHWLTAPRSTVIQPGAVRGGRSADVVATFAALKKSLGSA